MEEQTVKVAALMKSSEHATKVRVFAVTLIAHPTEGVIISGEESLAKLMTEILKNPALAREVKEAPARGEARKRTGTEKALQLFASPTSHAIL